MRILLDTHVLLWALDQPERLSKEMRARLQAPENDVLFSAASIWEIAIKVQIGRLRLTLQPEEVARVAVESGFEELPVYSVAAARVRQLPLHHRDPFDRLLIAQALSEPATLVTIDRTLAPYSQLVEVIT